MNKKKVNFIKTVRGIAYCAHFNFSEAGERKGMYYISVTKEGYVDFHQNGIEVSSSVCHINPVSIQAYLEGETISDIY